MTIEITVTSQLVSTAERVWTAAATMRGVNAELWPVVMTAPSEARELNIAAAPVGDWLFRSVVLLFWLIPLDVHRFRLESIGPGFRFQEDSTSLITRRWRHFRMVEPAGSGCVITDRLVITPRISLLGPLLAPVYRLIFWNRHRKLRRWYGGAT